MIINMTGYQCEERRASVAPIWQSSWMRILWAIQRSHSSNDSNYISQEREFYLKLTA